ncbi:MAG: hypothetical protein KatS3mg003_1868 [Candidatus Nitrosocaldaceae archaeon]|nr:MAG: hypothetical protein KatS3mg003_1868 [Candidatus Nitrosocaldaceae archaeon]
MLVLNDNEYIIKEVNAKCKINDRSYKGILYLTNNRMVFEDNKEGIILQLAYNQILAYRLIKGFSKKISIDFIDDNKYLLEIRCNDIDNIFNDIKDRINNYNMMIKIPIYVWEDNGIYGEYKHIEDRVFNNWEEYEKHALSILNNFSVEKKYIYLDEHRLELEPYIKRWISDIDFSKWNYPNKPEDYYLIHRAKAEGIGYRSLIKSITNNHTPYFLDKVTKEAMKLQATIEYIDLKELDKNYRDTNKYIIKEIENWLVGINVNHENGHFLLHHSEFVRVAQLCLFDYWNPITNIPHKSNIDSKIIEACKEWWKSLMNKDIDNARREVKIILSSYKDPLRLLRMTGEFELTHLYLEEMIKRDIPIPEYKPNYIK